MTAERSPDLTPARSFLCAGCSCLCDDVAKRFSGAEKIIHAEQLSLDDFHGCQKGLAWARQSQAWVEHLVAGQAVDLATALRKANELLMASRAPLVCGLGGLCTESQRAAFRLADRLRATIDTRMCNVGRGDLYALQSVGRVTATLGEVAQRTDLVLFWYCDPVSSHPRHLERYVRPLSKRNCRIVVVDERATETSRLADEFVCVPRGRASIVVGVLQSLFRGSFLDEQAVFAQTGRSIDDWQTLLAQLIRASYGAIFISGSGPSSLDSEAESLSKLVRILNERTRCVSLSMRDDGNTLSAENVLAWSSGFAGSVNLNRSYPRNFDQCFSAEACLENRACDLILLTSTAYFAENWSSLSEKAKNHFSAVPKIVLREANCEMMCVPLVEIAVARPGHFSEGDFCRQDDVALRLEPLYSTRTTSRIRANEVLDRLALGHSEIIESV